MIHLNGSVVGMGSTMKKKNLYIVIPAYNEEENILNVIESWYPIVEKYGSKHSRIVILNDGSKDNTSKLVKEIQKDKPLLKLVDKENTGHGATVLYGYKYALDNDADFVFQTDSDGQTLPSEFSKFWRLRNDYDMVIGYRNKREDGISRIFVTKVLKLVIRIAFKETVVDANTPFRLMNRKSLEKCIKLIPKDFNLSNVVLAVVYQKLGYKVKYLPVTFRQRQGGSNSINLKKISKIGKQALKDFRKINNSFKEAGLK